MSERKLQITDGVDVSIDGLNITVKGPKGTLTKDFNNPKFMKSVTVEKNNNEIIIKENKENRKTIAIIGTIAAHIRNMMRGVTQGYKYEMKIIYTHFPITVVVKDKEVQVKNFLGEKGIRTSDIVGDTQVKVEKDTVTVSGINLDEVSQTAANIELSCKLIKRDRRIFVDGIYVSEKHLRSGEKA